MTKKRKTRFFVYRNNPFRVLYMHGVGFQEPPMKHQRQLHVWWFQDRALVRKLIAGFMRSEQTSYADAKDYLRLRDGRPLIERTTPRNESINDL